MNELHSAYVHASGGLVQHNDLRSGCKLSGHNRLLNVSSGKALNADIQIHRLNRKIHALTAVGFNLLRLQNTSLSRKTLQACGNQIIPHAHLRRAAV